MEKIGNLLKATPETYRPLIATAIFTGARRGELLGLRWQDVDFAAGFVRIRNQLDRFGDLVEPKTPQAKRDVVLMPTLGKLLLEHRARSSYSQPEHFVFASRAGTPLLPRNVLRRGLAKGTEGAGIGSYVEDEDGKRAWKSAVRFHDLRHCFASILIAHGADPVSVSRQIGHADPSITLSVYAHEFDKARSADPMRSGLEEKYGVLLSGSTQAATGGNKGSNPVSGQEGEVVDLQAVRAGGNRR